ncbi:MAG: energy-coupling factor ABC transporter ATP-binding protein [Clostridium sp.]|jgi:cobalt/nickel transport system ATP-binding protein|nr:energy-coupling factor ABC transporter ATP-binding protein [Clostridium sp.]
MSHIRIEVDEVSFGYEAQTKVLEDITFRAGEREAIGIIGANGAGKSTLLKLLVGLYPDFEGSIRVEDIPVEKKMLARVREKIGYVFSDADSQLFLSTVCQDVAFAPRNYGLAEKEVERRTDQALRMVRIEHLKNRRIHELSGGEKKLVSIATVLSMTPDILLMDEPSIALDPQNRRNLIRILNGFEHLKLIASHDLDMILDTCGRAILMNRGRIVADGAAGKILADRELLEENGLELPLRYGGSYA